VAIGGDRVIAQEMGLLIALKDVEGEPRGEEPRLRRLMTSSSCYRR
jgi:hypothetical protein